MGKTIRKLGSNCSLNQIIDSNVGLTDEQLHQVFVLLDNQQNASEIYEHWIGSVRPELIDTSIKSYTGINLSDPKQRNELVFPLFRYNMLVIDYWLSNLVFPRESFISNFLIFFC